MLSPIEQSCAKIFRITIGSVHSVNIDAWDDQRLLDEPLEAMDVDSLVLLDFVMQVEMAYNVELDEAEVNCCRTIRNLAALVETASQRRPERQKA